MFKLKKFPPQNGGQANRTISAKINLKIYQLTKKPEKREQQIISYHLKKYKEQKVYNREP